MKYLNHCGVLRKVEMSSSCLHRFIEHPRNIYMPKKAKKQFQPLATAQGVTDVEDYLIRAVTRRRCVIAERDEITLIVVCNKLRYIVDSETLEVLSVSVRKGEWL